jgi:p21-activated kinase 1
VKFYNYSIKKKDNIEPFKRFITEDAIVEESAEIEELLIAKNAHNSDGSFNDETSSNEEQNNITTTEPPQVYDPDLPPPVLPPKKSSTSSISKPPIGPKPPIGVKPPRNISTKMKAPHKPMEDLRLIDKESVNDNNDNNIDLTFTNTKSTIVANKNNDLAALGDNENFSNNNTFIVHPKESTDSDEPILRAKKPTRVTKTDEEVYAELKNICNLSDPLERYKKTKEVGKGASGVVFIAQELGTDKQVAIKTIDLKNQSSKELILNEIRVLKDFNHRNLVNFLDAYYLEEEDHLWVVLEYMNGYVSFVIIHVDYSHETPSCGCWIFC